jgi:hypothetical protein
VKFYNAFNDKSCSTASDARTADMILVAVSLDPAPRAGGAFELPLWEWKLPTRLALEVEDLMRGTARSGPASCSACGSIRPTCRSRSGGSRRREARHERSSGRIIAAAAADDPLWYKDAIIYQLHVKSFFDSNNDGVGDFAG